jgi:hypothetical protein
MKVPEVLQEALAKSDSAGADRGGEQEWKSGQNELFEDDGVRSIRTGYLHAYYQCGG